MPMLLGTKEKDILQWRASANLVAALKEKLAQKWEQSPSDEAQSFLDQYLGALREERDYEAQLSCELDALNQGIAQAETCQEIPPLKARYLELVSAHFRRRRSVLALCELCCELHDKLLATALSFAERRMLQMGQGEAPRYALLVSGDRGRREQTLKGKNRYFLLHEEPASRFSLFWHQAAAALQEIGLLTSEAALWHCTLREWCDLLGESAPQVASEPETFLAALPPFAAPQKAQPRELPGGDWRPETLADLAFLQGEELLGAEAMAAATRALQGELRREAFLQVARRVIALPVALGRFGRWRLERGEKHKGELNLTQFALNPLVMALRVLALQAGTAAGGSVERIQRLLVSGALDLDLAESLLQAYQVIMQLRILIEMRGEEGEIYCNPEEFSTETEARFRNALEATLSLQKIGYQRLVVQG